MILKVRFFLLVLLLFSLLPIITGRPAGAHPHVFIEQKTRIVFDEKGLAGFKIHWAFDDMFSVMIAEDFDRNKNGMFEKNEIAAIREKAFGYIASANYFIHIKIDGKPFAVKFVKDFNAALEKGKLEYEFFIPCHVTATQNPKNIVLSPYDPGYYSAIYFPDSAGLFFDGADPFRLETSVKRDKSTLIYYETVNPLAIFINFRLKK